MCDAGVAVNLHDAVRRTSISGLGACSFAAEADSVALELVAFQIKIEHGTACAAVTAAAVHHDHWSCVLLLAVTEKQMRPWWGVVHR